MKIQVSLIAIFLLMLIPICSQSQELPKLPGNGLLRHPFLYAGEWQNHSMTDQTMYIVRNGKIVWSYTMPERGEYGDATMLSNGNIVFSRSSGASEITPDKKITWNYDAPEGTQVHTCQPIGKDRVFICQNGLPAKAMIINTKTGKIEMEHVLQTKSSTDPKTIHGQFRHIRMTKDSTFLVAHLDLGKVIEYDKNWNPIWSVDAPSAWAAVRLKNENTLISGNQHGYVREVNPKGEVVWEINKDDLPGIHLYTVQEVDRLANGNTVICNWFGGVKKEDWSKVVQIIEVTPDKKVVWALRQWADPDLGPASSIQLLDEPGIPENADLQR
jgi:Mal s 1 allergenic protein-like